MGLTERLEELNNMLWLDILESGRLEELSDEAYEIHTQLGLDDYTFVKNQAFCNFSINENTLEVDRFNPVRDGITRPIPPGAENAELKIHTFGPIGPVAEFVKKSLNLQFCLPVYNLQRPGKIFSVHRDYNRSLTRTVDTELSKTLKAKDFKKFIWFLEDQLLGQFFGAGQHCLSWKAGDIVCWPWYMPHGTANASLQDRPIIMISAI